jgi:hypothetical protein
MSHTLHLSSNLNRPIQFAKWATVLPRAQLSANPAPMKQSAFAALSLLSASAAHPAMAGAAYVAMGSSYAAGPGIGQSADTPPNRCARSATNAAHIFAQKVGLELKDVSCSGATTAHILGA